MQALLASAASCTAVGVIKKIQDRGVEIESLRVLSAGCRKSNIPGIVAGGVFTGIQFSFEIKVREGGATSSSFAELNSILQNHHCSVVDTLNPSLCERTIELKLL